MKSKCDRCIKHCKDKHPVSYCTSFQSAGILSREEKLAAIEFAVSRVNWHRQLAGLPDSSEEELEQVRKNLYIKFGINE